MKVLLSNLHEEPFKAQVLNLLLSQPDKCRNVNSYSKITICKQVAPITKQLLVLGALHVIDCLISLDMSYVGCL